MRSEENESEKETQLPWPLRLLTGGRGPISRGQRKQLPSLLAAGLEIPPKPQLVSPRPPDTPGRLRARSPRNHAQFVASHFSVSWHRSDKGRAGINFVSATVGTDVLPEVDSSHVLT